MAWVVNPFQKIFIVVVLILVWILDVIEKVNKRLWDGLFDFSRKRRG